MRWLVPRRRRGVEWLDDPAIADPVRERAMRDLARSNRWFGGTRALVRAMAPVLGTERGPVLLLDVGTGTGDLAAALRRQAIAAGRAPRVIGVDLSGALLARFRDRFDGAAAADALQLPLADAAVDVAACSQLLHHFPDRDARRLIAELHRVARHAVVIADIRRSWLAAAGFWLASMLLRFHPVTRHDGVVSVLRGFEPAELAAMVRDVTGITPVIRTGAFWRVSASWHRAAR